MWHKAHLAPGALADVNILKENQTKTKKPNQIKLTEASFKGWILGG